MVTERLKFSWNNVGFSAVAIGRVGDNPYNSHAGIIYKESDGKLYMLHLGWHFELHRWSYHHRYACVSPKIRPDRARSVAALCRLIWKRQHSIQKVPFSLSLSKEIRFDAITGNVVLSKGGLGLNCSNFVIIVYLQNGIDLIRLDTWKPRDNDKEWQEYLVMLLKKN